HERVVLLHEDGEAHEDRIENTARLTGGDHVDVELRERLGMLAERVGHGVAGFDVEHDLSRDVFQRRVLALLRQDVKRLHEREAGVDHRRELAGEDDDVAHLDAAQALLLRRRAFVDLDDAQALLLELLDDFVAIRRVDRRGTQVAAGGPRGVRELGHLKPRGTLGVGRGAPGHSISDDSAGQRLRTAGWPTERHQKPAGSPVRWVTVTGGSRLARPSRPSSSPLAAAPRAQSARYFRPAPAIAGDLAGVPLVSSGDTPIMRISSD